MSGATGRGPVRVVVAVVVAAGVAAGARAALQRVVGPRSARWTRVNHRGAPISLLEGPAAAAGAVGGVLVACAGRAGVAAALAGAGGAAFGLVDDLSEDTGRVRKGLRGHLGALAHGELTTGGLKVLGIGATSLAAAAVALPRDPDRGALAHGVDVAVAGALVAASANLLNLLDLRPGRALKAAGIGALPWLAGPGGPAAAAVLGAVGVALPADLDERDMLGDGGANALGAVMGTAAVLGTSRRARLALLAGAVGLTVASERVSFTQVIARTPVLRELDAWGRR